MLLTEEIQVINAGGTRENHQRKAIAGGIHRYINAKAFKGDAGYLPSLEAFL